MLLPISGDALTIPSGPLSRGVLVTPPAPRSPIVDVIRCPVARIGHLRHRSVWVVLLTIHQCWVEHCIVCIVLLLHGVLLHQAGVDGHIGWAGLGGCAGRGHSTNLGHLLGGVVAHGVAWWKGQVGSGGWGRGNRSIFTRLGLFLCGGRGGMRHVGLRDRLA